MDSTVYGGKPPHNGTDTSMEASAMIASEAGSLRDKVLRLIRSSPDGMTDWELVKSLNRPNDTITPRRRELVLMGMVRDSGRRRFSPAGRRVKVWKEVVQ